MYRGIILQMGGQYKENSGQVARGFDVFSSKNAQRKGPASGTYRTSSFICVVLLSGALSS